MDYSKVGKLISDLRKEKNMTQKQLGNAMNVSDKTISKWECGNGCPDVSLLHKLSNVLDVNIEKILLGDLNPNDTNGGNMKKLKFYLCETCGNIITAMGDAEIFCCGRKLWPLKAKPVDKSHFVNVATVEDEYYITFDHEMTKTHYFNFIAYVSYDRVLMVRLYPEQGGQVRFPKLHGGQLYFSCNKHGLWVEKIK